MEWRLVNDGGDEAPHGRMSHTCNVHENTLILFGGDDGGHLTASASDSHYQSYLNDMWALDLATQRWKRMV